MLRTMNTATIANTAATSTEGHIRSSVECRNNDGHIRSSAEGFSRR